MCPQHHHQSIFVAFYQFESIPVCWCFFCCVNPLCSYSNRWDHPQSSNTSSYCLETWTFHTTNSFHSISNQNNRKTESSFRFRFCNLPLEFRIQFSLLGWVENTGRFKRISNNFQTLPPSFEEKELSFCFRNKQIEYYQNRWNFIQNSIWLQFIYFYHWNSFYDSLDCMSVFGGRNNGIPSKSFSSMRPPLSNLSWISFLWFVLLPINTTYYLTLFSCRLKYFEEFFSLLFFLSLQLGSCSSRFTSIISFFVLKQIDRFFLFFIFVSSKRFVFLARRNRFLSL